MRRTHCIPGATLLFLAFILSLLTALSLPYVREFDFVRVTFQGNPASANDNEAASQTRLGIWGYCYEAAKSGEWVCHNTGNSYTITVGNVTIGSSWTRGLLIHPVATAATFAAFALSLIPSVSIMLLASFTSWLAAFLTLIAFFCDIALFAYFKNKMNELSGVQSNTNPGPAFWMTFVTFFLLCFAGCAVLVGRKKERYIHGDSHVKSRRPFFHRFRRSHY